MDNPTNSPKKPESFDAIIEKILSYKKIVIASHYNPDADAYGSSLGLAHALIALGKDIRVVNESGILDRYTAIPGIDLVTDRWEISDSERLHTLLIVCDCGAKDRVGQSFQGLYSSCGCSINIDHHISNDNFAELNYVDVGASSTSEIIFDLLSAAKITFGYETARCLLGGIIGDTGSFRYSSTTSKTMRCAAELMDKGVTPHEIYRSLYGAIPLKKFQLQNDALKNIEFFGEGKFVLSVITEDMRKASGATLEDTDGIVEKLRDVEGVCISATLREDGLLWRVSLRSISKEYNVSELAASFGGGGHVEAAAFRVQKKLGVLKEELISKALEVISQGGISGAKI